MNCVHTRSPSTSVPCPEGIFAVHEPGSSMYLATHPRLPDRILRVCGSALPPLPAPLIHMDTPEPRVPRAARVALGASAGAAGVPADPIRQAEQARQQRIANDKDAHGRLQRMVGPTERRLIVLALMMNIGNERERKLWHRMAESLPQAARILDDVAALLPTRRVPEFERVTTSIAADPIEQRRTLALDADAKPRLLAALVARAKAEAARRR